MTTTLDTVHELTQAEARYCLAIDTKDWAARTDRMSPDIEPDVSDGNTGVPVVTRRDNAEQSGTTDSSRHT
ncbi:hypothetical protein [Nocardia sp. NPDC052112]|uniref:hypothetical protein n=1 Tax=Nocardia sp. NPDC052112 TaxID=3155646 RepID=UPI00341943C4